MSDEKIVPDSGWFAEHYKCTVMLPINTEFARQYADEFDGKAAITVYVSVVDPVLTDGKVKYFGGLAACWATLPWKATSSTHRKTPWLAASNGRKVASRST